MAHGDAFVTIGTGQPYTSGAGRAPLAQTARRLALINADTAACMVCGSVTRRKAAIVRNGGEYPWFVCLDADACRADAGLAPL